jgi:S1-C subfamily serine protease
VLTHVINGSTKITATVGSTGKTYPATVVGYDKTGVRDRHRAGTRS